MKINPRFAGLAKIPGALIPSTKRKPRGVKVTIKERDLQSMAENLCVALGIRFFRIPDTLLGYLASCPAPWIRVFVARYFAGVPDLLLFKSLPDGRNEVRFIEIKTEAGKLSQGQAKWHSGLEVIVCYGWDQVESAIKSFVQGEAPLKAEQ